MTDTLLLDDGLDSVRQENINRILDAAERLFRHYGYSKTTVADIARDLGMSTANIYRFFASKQDIHQALCSRMLQAAYDLARSVAGEPASAAERLRRYASTQHKMTVDTMLDQEKVHEMVVVAIERDWHVIEKHIIRLHAIVAEIIADGIATGEFRPQDPEIASKCFGASLVTLCHPQMVAQCLMKENQARAEDLIEFAIQALR
ncbi:AcrR family transcriptional regulator [Rhizobium azooxidifex]|uniref:AcrR family transcriptional regulator n=1 Tax=Mycoplana azooxidifex TaxID=1636188 RepID=A0A7W6DD81_9HYPH|nr:TetR family transcriptional regulator [Mycoplana azooxidifex]MBB3977653.1 AcrR family transcriptional regulator [Mycoplana azooxidifex]